MQRHAALFTEGTERLDISDCVFERLDGNAVAISGYSRNATVRDSDFSFISNATTQALSQAGAGPVYLLGPFSSTSTAYLAYYAAAVNMLLIWAGRALMLALVRARFLSSNTSEAVCTSGSGRR